MAKVTSESSDIVPLQRPPGYLMAPFGWAAKPLTAMLEAEPTLYGALFSLSRQRMHLIGLVLAHIEAELTLDLGPLLLRGSLRQIFTEALDRSPPAGLSRALAHMPFNLLARQGYRRLIELLDHEPSATLLYHADDIDDSTIELFYRVPAALRRPVLHLVLRHVLRHSGGFPDLDGLADGLAILTSLGAAPSVDALVGELATAREPDQFVAKLNQVVDRLPLPEVIVVPPAHIGLARRLDSIREDTRCGYGLCEFDEQAVVSQFIANKIDFRGSELRSAYAAEVANSIGSTIEGSSFSGLLTRVEIGHIRMGSAGNGRIKSEGSGSSLNQRA